MNVRNSYNSTGNVTQHILGLEETLIITTDANYNIKKIMELK